MESIFFTMALPWKELDAPNYQSVNFPSNPEICSDYFFGWSKFNVDGAARESMPKRGMLYDNIQKEWSFSFSLSWWVLATIYQYKD